MPLAHDVDVTRQDLADLVNADALAAWLDRLGYDTGGRRGSTPTAVGVTNPDEAIQSLELLSEDPDRYLDVYLAELRSLTARARSAVVAGLGRRNRDHLIVLTADWKTIEFLLIVKDRKSRRGPAAGIDVVPRPVSFTVDRRSPSREDLRTLRQLTFTRQDGLDQYDKLRVVFQSARFSSRHFVNRAVFSDYYLLERLRESDTWKQSPNKAFDAARRLFIDKEALLDLDRAAIEKRLYHPLFESLGFEVQAPKGTAKDSVAAHATLTSQGKPRAVALFYTWERFLDGPDHEHGADQPEQNPGAAVVSLLSPEDAPDWAIVTNGKKWRLYSKRSKSVATNYYEVDIEEALAAGDGEDPNEAFRYWWLFFRATAFEPVADDPERTWLDTVIEGSRDYAKKVEEDLRERVYARIVPRLAAGFLHDKRNRLKDRSTPDADELERIRESTLTLLYRLLFLLYAEARDLLPVNEGPYRAVSLEGIKKEIAEEAGEAPTTRDEKLEKAYKTNTYDLYERLEKLFAIIADGDAAVNVPPYDGGLFLLKPTDDTDPRDAAIVEFLTEHRIPDRWLAGALDDLARTEDDRTCGLVLIDYKSLGVRHLGSIYEGLLEFKLAIAEEDLTVKKEKGREVYSSHAIAMKKSPRRTPKVAVEEGHVYLTNDKAERKATGSYYTPDHIVEYIVRHTVGPVLDRKLEALRDDFRKAEKDYQRLYRNCVNDPAIVKASLADPAPEGDELQRRARLHAAEHTYQMHRDLFERFFDVKVLDPAMGSGHFLVEAVDFVTDRMLRFLNAFRMDPVTAGLADTKQSILKSLGDKRVEIDSERLTDVTLLKRHVLKRCIYGVDINPLACELAKVSLWLDAFTLGAPLSFLDHHLRCGNSLVGSTISELKSLLGERMDQQREMFGISYDGLLQALRDVLFIARLADATAQEVDDSRRHYADARSRVAAYSVLLDLVIAPHFGFPKALELLKGGRRIDTASRESLLASLTDDDRALLSQIDAISAERRVFHWDIQFPEVFYELSSGVGLAGSKATQQISDRPRAARGFDAVVGNPPYLRQESLKRDKRWYAQAFQSVFDATADLYVYFIQREVELLKCSSRMGMIVTNKWLRAAYGAPVRSFLLHDSAPCELIDFGHAPVFDEADVFPCILIAESIMPNADRVSHSIRMCACPREDYSPAMDIAGYVESNSFSVPTAELRADAWLLEPPEVQRIIASSDSMGTRLADYVGHDTFLGIKTGYNEAFYLTSQQKSDLVRTDPRAQQFIQPLIRGRDIRRWFCDDSQMYAIVVPSSENAHHPWSDEGRNAEDAFRDAHPSLFNHLAPFRDRCASRSDKGRYWWELRSCTYYNAIRQPKIVLKCIAYHSEVAMDAAGHYPNNSANFILSNDLYLLGILNSPLMWFIMTRILPHKKDEALAMDGTRIDELPVVAGDSKAADEVRCLVAQRLDIGPVATSKQVLSLEREISVAVEAAYGLSRSQRGAVRRACTVRDPLRVMESQLEEAPTHG